MSLLPHMIGVLGLTLNAKNSLLSVVSYAWHPLKGFCEAMASKTIHLFVGTIGKQISNKVLMDRKLQVKTN